MSVLLCDSNCELWYTRAEELGLDYISMPYYYDGEEYYYDLGKKTDFKKFYSAVRKGTIPTTQALNPENYKEILTPYFEKGEDVIYISFSHAMSGTFAHLETALKDLKEQFPERKCTVFDTKAISMGAGMMVEAAAELKNKGATDEEILEFLENFRDRLCTYVIVDDLMHLKRGGRLSATAAIAGSMLNLKPVLTFDEKGSLGVLEKVIGRKKTMRKIADKVAEELTGTEYNVYVLDADSSEDGDALAKMIEERRPDAKIVRQTIGPVIGAHAGPDTMVVFFIGDKRPIPLAK